MRISYEFHTIFTFPEYSHKFIHAKFVRNWYEIRMNFVRISYEFHVNFVQFANKQSKHTSKHTLHSHGQVMLHAPVFAHLGNRHVGTVFTRCHSVVGRNGGAMPVMAKWISDSASTLSPLQTSSWCTLPTKNSMHCSPTSMTSPAHNVIHPQCPQFVRCLLQLMVGDGEGLVMGEGVGCEVGARGQAGELGHSLLGHDSKRRMRRL